MVDMFTRKVEGWSVKSQIIKELVLNALLMTVWHWNHKSEVMVHSDQDNQYTIHDWQTFLKDSKIECSISRKGNCYDNAVAETFFKLLKRERT